MKRSDFAPVERYYMLALSGAVLGILIGRVIIWVAAFVSPR